MIVRLIRPLIVVMIMNQEYQGNLTLKHNFDLKF